MKNIPAIEIEAAAATSTDEQQSKLTLIPYYAWNNRGDYKQMNVWFARDAATVRNSVTMLTGNVANVRASFTYSDDEETAIADGKHPTSSADTSIPRWTSWPQLGKEQQIDITLKNKMPIKALSVYWYNDNGGVKYPVKWHAEYYADGEYHKYLPGASEKFGTKGDCFNKVKFNDAAETDKLRIYATPRKDASVGILELIIE